MKKVEVHKAGDRFELRIPRDPLDPGAAMKLSPIDRDSIPIASCYSEETANQIARAWNMAAWFGDMEMKQIVISALLTAIIADALRLNIILDPNVELDRDLLNGIAATLADECTRIVKEKHGL